MGMGLRPQEAMFLSGNNLLLAPTCIILTWREMKLEEKTQIQE